jgi:hypothetical protein
VVRQLGRPSLLAATYGSNAAAAASAAMDELEEALLGALQELLRIGNGVGEGWWRCEGTSLCMVVCVCVRVVVVVVWGGGRTGFAYSQLHRAHLGLGVCHEENVAWQCLAVLGGSVVDRRGALPSPQGATAACAPTGPMSTCRCCRCCRCTRRATRAAWPPRCAPPPPPSPRGTARSCGVRRWRSGRCGCGCPTAQGRGAWWWRRPAGTRRGRSAWRFTERRRGPAATCATHQSTSAVRPPACLPAWGPKQRRWLVSGGHPQLVCWPARTAAAVLRGALPG